MSTRPRSKSPSPCRSCKKKWRLRSSAESATKREEALSTFMRAAKKQKKSGQIQNTDPLVGQFLVNVGRMEFEAGKAKGILDRSFPSVKIPIHKDSSYADLNEKCRECVWGDPSNEYKYYMADGTGTAIGSNSFSIDLEDKTKTVLPWTLSNYLKVSGVKYPSRLRLYCVRKFETAEESVSTADSSTSECEDAGQQNEGSSDVSVDEPSGYFDVLFYVPKRSKYRAKTSFKLLNQQQILYEEDLDVRDVVDRNPGLHYLFEVNPLIEGCYLHSVTFKGKEFMFAKSHSCDSGTVTYRCPGEEDTFDTWSGGYACGDVVLMACIAINGYHSRSSYSWQHDQETLLSQSTPLLYTSSKGSFTCSVKCESFEILSEFRVEGFSSQCKVQVVKNTTLVHEEVMTEPFTEGAIGVETRATGKDELENEKRNTVTSDMPGGTVGMETRTTAVFQDDKFEEKKSIATSANIASTNNIIMTKEDIEGIKNSCNDTDKLHLLTVVGSGSFGQVYKAIYKGCIVAAKVVVLVGNTKVVDNELNAFRTLHHPNILTFIGIIKERSRITILTNYVVGKNLYELLHDHDKKVKLSYIRKLNISMQITQALVYMHSHSPQMVHLDLKPENVMIEESTFHVYLADFGLGKMLNNCGSAGRTTMQAGTPAFQPPEQIRGELVGVGTDMYALACIVLEIFGERQLWEGLAPHTIILKVAGGSFPSTSHVSVEIQDLVAKCFVPVELRLSAATFLKSLCELMATELC